MQVSAKAISPEGYNASIVATAARPFLYIARATGIRYTFTAKQHEFYLKHVGRRALERTYVVEEFAGQLAADRLATL